MTLVKVCGIRTLDEARAALEAGADWLGFVLWAPSKRYVKPEHVARIVHQLRAERRDWLAVGVFVEPGVAEAARAAELCGLDLVQLSGDEPPDLVGRMPRRVLKALRVRAGAEADAAVAVRRDHYGAWRYLLDTHREGQYGGTGASFDWDALRAVGRDCLVAGGLRPDNVRAALETLAPLGVDVSGGVERPSGGKDPALVRAFVEAVKRYDAHLVGAG